MKSFRKLNFKHTFKCFFLFTKDALRCDNQTGGFHPLTEHLEVTSNVGVGGYPTSPTLRITLEKADLSIPL